MQLDPTAFASDSQVSTVSPAQSPSKNPCKVRVRPGNYRNEPYGFRVLPPIVNRPAAPLLSLNQEHTTPASYQVEPSVRRMPPPLSSGFATHANSHHSSSSFAARMYEKVAYAAEFASPNYELQQASGRQLQQLQHYNNIASQDFTEQEEFEPTAPSFLPPAPSYRRNTPKSTPPPQRTPVELDDEAFAFVRFKYESCCYRVRFHVEVGDRVLVEGDRGCNLGMVERTMKELPNYPVPCYISRFATDDEVRMSGELRLRELEATQYASELSSFYKLPIRIVDTEFQSDGQKLTVYFDSERFIDFRRLQRALFREYNCRIWLVNWKEVRH